MMTSRSEYRLLLRQDNAEERLTEKGHDIGLVTEKRYNEYLQRREAKYNEIKRIRSTVFSPSDRLNEILVSRETSPVTTGVHMDDLLRRPQIDYLCLAEVDTNRPELPMKIWKQAETEIKYEGYIKRELAAVAEMKRLEEKKLPDDVEYAQIVGLRLEAIEKLNKIRPENIGQASRISGVSPADISVLLIWLAKWERGND